MTVEWGADPDHPVLPKPWEWRITSLRIELEPKEEDEPFLDLRLRRNEERCRLRFWSPRDLQIGRNWPHSLGMAIYDIRHRGMEGLGVRVDDYEAGGGAMRFVARAVERAA